MTEKISLENVHKDKHPCPVDIVVMGEILDNAIEAQKDAWFTVESINLDHKERMQYAVRHQIDCKDVKIFERK